MEKAFFVDCFNTVICRTKSPRDVFLDLAKKLGQKYSIEPAVVYNQIVKTEKECVFKNFKITHEYDYLWEEQFSAALTEKFKDILSTSQQKQFQKDVVEVYYDVERQSHYVDNSFIESLKEKKAKGAQIFLVSDFYCHKSVLQDWLKAQKVDALFDDVFVSCDCNKTKSRGTIFPFLLEKLNLKAKEVCMIGDNRHSDFRMAKKAGLNTIFINRKEKKESSFLRKTKNHGINCDNYKQIYQTFGKNFGFSNYAFPLFLFMKRLFKTLQEKKIENVFFLAREGQFLKAMFDVFCQHFCGGENFKTHYLEVSRNSVFVSVLKPIDEENFETLLRWPSKISVYNFLKSLDFLEEQIAQITQDFQINIRKTKADFLNTEDFKLLKNSPLFLKLYDEKREGCHEAFDKYIKSFGVDFQTQPFVVVDVGWGGTIQDCLFKFFDYNVNLQGYYFGVTSLKPISNENKFGLLCSKFSPRGVEKDIYFYNRLIWERLCSANHNRVAGYILQNGKVEVQYDDSVDEVSLYNQLIHPLQSQIAEKFEMLCKIDFLHCSQFDAIAARAFCKMIAHATNADVSWLVKSEKTFYDNFGRIGFYLKGGGSFFKKMGHRFCNFCFAVYCKFKFMLGKKKLDFKKVEMED